MKAKPRGRPDFRTLVESQGEKEKLESQTKRTREKLDRLLLDVSLLGREAASDSFFYPGVPPVPDVLGADVPLPVPAALK